MDSTIGSKLRQLRQSNGLTQQQLADLMKVSNKAVSKWENDEGTPDIANLKRLSQIFNVSIDTILLNESMVEVTTESKGLQKYIHKTKDWVAMSLAFSPFVLYFMTLFRIDASHIFDMGWDGMSPDIFDKVTINISVYNAITQVFNNFTIGNLILSIGLIWMLIGSVIIIIKTYKQGVLNVQKHTFIVFSGLSGGVIATLVSLAFFLGIPGLSITITPFILIVVYGILAFIIKTAY